MQTFWLQVAVKLATGGLLSAGAVTVTLTLAAAPVDLVVAVDRRAIRTV